MLILYQETNCSLYLQISPAVELIAMCPEKCFVQNVTKFSLMAWYSYYVPYYVQLITIRYQINFLFSQIFFTLFGSKITTNTLYILNFIVRTNCLLYPIDSTHEISLQVTKPPINVLWNSYSISRNKLLNYVNYTYKSHWQLH